LKSYEKLSLKEKQAKSRGVQMENDHCANQNSQRVVVPKQEGEGEENKKKERRRRTRRRN
jgi:hypothetical protein